MQIFLAEQKARKVEGDAFHTIVLCVQNLQLKLIGLQLSCKWLEDGDAVELFQELDCASAVVYFDGWFVLLFLCVLFVWLCGLWRLVGHSFYRFK